MPYPAPVGRSLTHVLTLLRDIDGGAYDSLSQKFRLYAACVGLVDTGYFRKRSGATLPMVSPHERPARRTPFDHQIQVRDLEVANSDLPFSKPDEDALHPPPGVYRRPTRHLAGPDRRPPPGSAVRKWLSRFRTFMMTSKDRTRGGEGGANSGR